jgi:hypothetical protein
VKPSIKHVVDSDFKKHYNTLMSTEVIIIVTHHRKDLCHSNEVWYFDDFISKMKSQSTAYLLNGSEHIKLDFGP